MFKAKKIDTQEIYPILAVHVDETYNITYFLIWYRSEWTWKPAKEFVPPNWGE